MLNRLMFCYFIQKKEFLDKDIHYLRNKLRDSQEKRGQDQFYGFYRHFLLTLFHEGLNIGNQDKAIKDEIGRIPYLNGGLFDVHELEEKYKDKIQIPDKAFDSLFTFFDEWTWHLDTRPGASEKEINPDVIGYIFEKYINERAKMGAYYTKEDITEYISKNCIIPFLFEETRRNSTHRDFDSHFAQVLAGTGDRYIYDAVKKGIPPFELVAGNEDKILRSELPDDVQAGLDAPDETLVESRKCWNRPAPDGIALPTEIYRELVERRKRYLELRQKIENGEIASITDFITFNLNIRQFAQDFLYSCNDPAVLRSFFKALTKVSILDPTCGSGAFLFAALNILEPLYETCLDRMQALVSDEDLQNLEDKSTHLNRFKDFRDILAQILNEQHPNRQYFIYKSIILNNLYGVDIMKEAVEIAKLRLFLKLVSTASADFTAKGVGKNYGLEPLPDIDFNIRCGNTLVGFATEKALETGSLDFKNDKQKVLEQLEKLSMAFAHFKNRQLTGDSTPIQIKDAKKDYRTQLEALKGGLDKAYFHAYNSGGKDLEAWKESHQPFHWFAEFYEIVHDKGGFDVITGNPPYVVYSDSSTGYKISGYKSAPCKDLYGFTIERSLTIKSINGLLGMIVPISLISTEGFEIVQSLLWELKSDSWFSSFSMRPGKLFEGVEKRLNILIQKKSNIDRCFTTKYHTWSVEERENLFNLIGYVQVEKYSKKQNQIPKIGLKIEASILSKIQRFHPISASWVSSKRYIVYHTRKLRYFLQFLDKPPQTFDEAGNVKTTSEIKELYFNSETDKHAATSIYLSTLFFWYFILHSDCRNLNKREVASFPVSLSEIEIGLKLKLENQGLGLIKNLQVNSYYQITQYEKYGALEMQIFRPRESKPIVDEIDTLLAKHYGFTAEELDFIINYDIKYRMGKELNEEEI
jgi:hypothetical protein